VAWTELDTSPTQPTETDIVFGPASLITSIQGMVIAQLDNLPTQNPHYALIPTYINQAKDEILTLGLSMGRNVLDHLPRMRNWRWMDITQAGVSTMPLPERMLYLEAMSYTKSLAPYDPSSVVLFPSTPVPSGSATEFGLYPRTATGWPTLFHRAGSSIELWPPPVSTPTDFRTAIVVYGTRMDNILVNNTDVLLMSPRLQLLTVDLAVVIAMEKMGWDEGPERRAALESKLGRLIGMGTKERIHAPIKTRVGGTPS
jgi:hypothetical protein